MDPRSLYKWFFFQACVKAAIRNDFDEPGEEVLEKALAGFD